MNAQDIDQKFALRAYTIGEIDRLRNAVSVHLYYGAYTPTAEHFEDRRRNRDLSAPSSIVEDRLRTLMIAGLVAEDLYEDIPEGFVLEKTQDGQGPLWWSWRHTAWVAPGAPTCVFPSEKTALNIARGYDFIGNWYSCPHEQKRLTLVDDMPQYYLRTTGTCTTENGTITLRPVRSEGGVVSAR